MSRLLQEYILNQKRQRILCMNISHTKVYFTGYKQTKLWVKEVERERATWYLGSSKSWFTKSYLIFFSLPAFKGWKDSKSSSQQPAGACYPIQPQPHTVILPKWIPNEMVYFRHKVPLSLSKVSPNAYTVATNLVTNR